MSEFTPELTQKSAIETVPVTESLSLQFDLTDGWFGVTDADSDEVGAVLVYLTDLDALIIALQELRQRLSAIRSGEEASRIQTKNLNEC